MSVHNTGSTGPGAMRIRLLRCGGFERLDELRELRLVRERDLELPSRDLAGKARNSNGRGLRPGEEIGIEADALLAPRLGLCAGPPGSAFGRSHRETLLHHGAGEPTAALLVRDAEDRARVPFAQLTALDHRQHVLG